MAVETADPRGRKILENTQIWDAHIHLGIDRDGNTQSFEEIISQMKYHKVGKAVVFPFDAINRANSFHVPNGYILSAFNKRPKMIIPFFRLDPNLAWKKEALLRAKQGFRGIKLHPRAQNFSLVDPKAMRIYEFAEERNLPVLVHTGLGTEKIASHAERITRRFKDLKLILGHAGFVDIEGVVGLLLRKPYLHVYLETSTLKIYDLYDILRKIPANKIIFGSDIPYADMQVGIEALIDVALMLGFSENDIQNMLYRNLAGCLGERI
ncbi:MAG: hypothetical protein EPN86_06455 [Nanoarchaeota archaeon]|nr:MAG: hypothetical protein EPN86_06455 [Nanoarchaeota archaeon]